MRKLRLFASATVVALSLVGCQTIDNKGFGVEAPKVVVAKDMAVTNGMFAEVAIRLLGQEGIVKDITDHDLCIQELQRIQVWPRGNYLAGKVISAQTMLEVNALLVQKQRASYTADATIEPASEVEVRIYDIGVGPEDTIEKTATVDKNGDITLPMVRKVNIAGLTASVAAEKIRKTYIDKGFFRDLTVDVTAEVGFLFISGEINTPGRVDFKGGMTLTELIISSGDFTEFAKRSAVKIVRGKKTSYHDYEKILRGEEEDPILKPGDRVVVERRYI